MQHEHTGFSEQITVYVSMSEAAATSSGSLAQHTPFSRRRANSNAISGQVHQIEQIGCLYPVYIGVYIDDIDIYRYRF